jgi:hypothetical protein
MQIVRLNGNNCGTPDARFFRRSERSRAHYRNSASNRFAFTPVALRNRSNRRRIATAADSKSAKIIASLHRLPAARLIPKRQFYPVPKAQLVVDYPQIIFHHILRLADGISDVFVI